MPLVPTFMLAFDHRTSLLSTFLEAGGEPTEDDRRAARQVKSLIADGLVEAIETGIVERVDAAALVDTTFGSNAIEDLGDAGVRVAVPVEASGRRELVFEHPDWRERLDSLRPTWAKVLVRYNVSGDAAMNERQCERVLDLQTVARGIGVGFLFELLVPPEPDQRGPRFDTGIRPSLMVQAIDELRAAGVGPDLWKIEGLYHRSDCEAVAASAQAPCVVLGRGADPAAVEEWLRAGAGVAGYEGFAIGRSIWWEPARAYLDGADDRAKAVARIAERYGHFVEVYRAATDR